MAISVTFWDVLERHVDIQRVGSMASDDGTLFGWSMAFSPDIAPEINTFEPIGHGQLLARGRRHQFTLRMPWMASKRSVPMATLWMFCLERRDP